MLLLLVIRSAPIPLIAPPKIELLTSRSVVVPRAGMLSALTFCAEISVEDDGVLPLGKNCTNALAIADDADTPIGELLKMLISVMKFVPFAPATEPTTGRKTSFDAAIA